MKGMGINMEIDYIIVQAGGKGSRLKKYTTNKPKAIVPVNNLPMIFYLFRLFPDKRFIIIGDYKKDVLQRYMDTFAEVKYVIVDAQGKAGTCAGIKKAIAIIPDEQPFMLIWSDLILPEDFQLPKTGGNYVGIAKDFSCRWKFEKGKFKEEASYEQGVAGLFLFRDKFILKDIPEEGELVRWMCKQGCTFNEMPLYKTKEYGLEETIKTPESGRCRPFNQLEISEGRVIKRGINEQGRELAEKEKKWYEHCLLLGYDAIPQIYAFDPIVMKKIEGKNVFEYDFNFEQKKDILNSIALKLMELHSLEQGETDYFSIWETYYVKTMERLRAVRDLIPFTNQEYIWVNNRKCRNVFFYQNQFAEKIKMLRSEKFRLIHGDCTFSNILLRKGKDPVFIDPRGYFGFTKYLGDTLYDWAKLYYSLKGNYDQFNLKRFELQMNETEVFLEIESNHWEDMEQEFWNYAGIENTYAVKLIHAIIWLSLTTYAWEDYDSICGAFYNGIYYLEEIL